MLQRILMALLVALSAQCFALAPNEKAVLAASPTINFIEGKHYQVLTKALPFDPNLPVTEFMYFGCKTCYKLSPALVQWSYEKKIGVTLVPTHSETAMVDAARMFHTFEVLGVLNTMYEEGFLLFQTEKSDSQGEARVNKSLAQHGIDKDKFWAAWKSEAVNKRLAASADLSKMAQIAKTPTFVVHGIYRVDIESVKSVEELFQLLEYLVAKKPPIPSLLKKAA